MLNRPGLQQRSNACTRYAFAFNSEPGCGRMQSVSNDIMTWFVLAVCNRSVLCLVNAETLFCEFLPWLDVVLPASSSSKTCFEIRKLLKTKVWYQHFVTSQRSLTSLPGQWRHIQPPLAPPSTLTFCSLSEHGNAAVVVYAISPLQTAG